MRQAWSSYESTAAWVVLMTEPALSRFFLVPQKTLFEKQEKQ